MPALLLDANLPRRLAKDLAPRFPGTMHVSDIALDRSSDREIWTYAAERGVAIVSKDGDFHHLSLTFGAPPKSSGFDQATYRQRIFFQS